jgi:hypothetical protein
MKASFLLIASLLLTSTAAVANPRIGVQELRGQASGPHVKLTYTTNCGGDLAVTYGTSQSPWVKVGSLARDTGSGSEDIPILEMCDCHVPTGSTLNYEIAHGNYATVFVSTQVSVPASPTGGDGDCTTACQLADAAVADAGRPDARASDAGTPDKSNGSGCAFVAPGRSSALICLALLGVAIASRRRRP